MGKMNDNSAGRAVLLVGLCSSEDYNVSVDADLYATRGKDSNIIT